MTEIFQTDTSRERGNCLQAVIASLLDAKDIGDVPYFSPIDWRRGIARYFFDHYGKIVSTFQSTSGAHLRKIIADSLSDGFYIASVESFTHPNCAHAVVALIKDGDLTVAHDPNRANAGREQYEYVVIEIISIV